MKGRKPGPLPSVGDGFALLMVVELPFSAGRHGYRCRVRCVCGTERVVWVTHLRTERTRSCGKCLPRGPLTHDRSRTPEHRVWAKMKARCQNPTDTRFPYYGARGIRVCARWQSFEAFFADMGQRPDGRFSIDRIDNAKGYEPGNCRWTTHTEQMRNTRRTKFVTLGGERLSLPVACERTGLRYAVIQQRLVHGWTESRAFSTPTPHQERQ